MTYIQRIHIPTVTETCPCGATITVTADASMARKVELDDFRRAHADCRKLAVDPQDSLDDDAERRDDRRRDA